ncbi:precorrin-3B synthase [Streptomyces sp. NRRL F-5126]|uniref:precorrin-3B synthase n=1 Tax=Streptomyces sp. NRRL F-5126 TaxID=1463857 RepID=UPI001F2E39F1|nr:precorrin-3B synthase [Streptomyces sp. NRRL F-5126]
MPATTPPTGANPHGQAVRERGDACPGALRLHAADDGRLARLRLPGGLLTPHQAMALADAAERLGDGGIDLTSRGNVQLRGLCDAGAGPLAEALHAVGLLPSERHERARNIVASPLAGEDQHPFADVRLWVRALDALICGSGTAAGLSGRFLFALDDGRGDVAGLGADVTLLAEPAGATALLRVGGDRLRVPHADGPRAALAAAEAFLGAAAASGAWRVRELPEGHDLSARLAAALAVAGVTAWPAQQGGPEPQGGSDPQGGPPALGVIRPPGQVRAAVSVQPRLGRATAAQWRLLASAGGDDGEGDGGGDGDGLRITPWRGIVVPGLTPGAADELLARAAAAGLVTSADSPWYGVGACTGRPGCGKALADVRADAAASLGAHAPGLPVYFSGCARRCGHPQGRYVDKVATAGGTYTTTTTTTTTGTGTGTG